MEIRRWGLFSWSHNDDLKVFKMVGVFFHSDFEDREEADRMLKLGRRFFKGKNLILDQWDLEVGCRRN